MLRVARVIQGEERKLDARRARIETDDRLHAEACGSPGAAFGAARASSAAIAQDARRVRSLSARLVRMMGTRAPRTTPAASAPPREVRDRKRTRLNSSHYCASRMPSSA